MVEGPAESEDIATGSVDVEIGAGTEPVATVGPFKPGRTYLFGAVKFGLAYLLGLVYGV